MRTISGTHNFAHPHSPWERGSNENLINWIVREYLPKAWKSPRTPKYLAMVAATISDRPRSTP